jgi:hypothetical protein
MRLFQSERLQMIVKLTVAPEMPHRQVKLLLLVILVATYSTVDSQVYKYCINDPVTLHYIISLLALF